MSVQTPTRPKPKMPHAADFMNLPKPVLPKTENRKLLKGQKAIVTGASSGIGRSIALALGHAGAGRPDDARTMEQSHQRQSDWTISLLPRSDPRIQTPRCPAGDFVLRWKDYLH